MISSFVKLLLCMVAGGEKIPCCLVRPICPDNYFKISKSMNEITIGAINERLNVLGKAKRERETFVTQLESIWRLAFASD